MNDKIIQDTLKIAMSNILIVLSGVVTGFVLPKVLGITDYGLYKIFNLYATYTVFCDLGISNGVYLKYGGYKRADLPRTELRLYFKILLLLQIGISMVVITISKFLVDNEYMFIVVMIVGYGVANNIATFFEKISIMIGEFKASIQRNISKSILSIIIVLIVWAIRILEVNIRLYKVYTILFVAIYFFLAVQYAVYYHELIMGKKEDFWLYKKKIWMLITSGFILLLADTIANLILTIDRQFVSILFDIDTYAIYSFAYSMLKIIVLAISAIATVMYPMLKRMTSVEMKYSYNSSIATISMISFGCLMAYYPLSLIVRFFLPAYEMSLPIFRVLFPSISINAIISLVMINHYKALGYQKKYFLISIMILLLSLFTNTIAYILVKKAVSFCIASVITISVWYIVSDIVLKNIYKISCKRQYLYIILSMLGYYLVSGMIENYYIGFVINLIYYIAINLMIYKNEFYTIINYVMTWMKRGKE